MTTPIGSNPSPQIEFSQVDGTPETGDTVVNSDAVQSAVKSNIHEQIRERARELLDRLSDENYWDAKSDSLESRDELQEQQKLFEHLEELGLITNKAGGLEKFQNELTQ